MKFDALFNLRWMYMLGNFVKSIPREEELRRHCPKTLNTPIFSLGSEPTIFGHSLLELQFGISPYKTDAWKEHVLLIYDTLWRFSCLKPGITSRLLVRGLACRIFADGAERKRSASC